MTKTKPKKLPKVWVLLTQQSEAWAVYMTRTAAERDEVAGDVLQLYAPVQKPKVCVWTAWPGATLGDHKSACGWWMTRDARFDYCPCCGGKIQVKGPR